MSSCESSSCSSTEEEYEIGALYDQNGKKVHVRRKKTTKCMSTLATIFESVFCCCFILKSITQLIQGVISILEFLD